MTGLEIKFDVSCEKCNKRNYEVPIFTFVLKGNLKGFCFAHYEQFKTEQIMKAVTDE